jgi:SAM-dependent methyltransferase
MIIRDTNYYNAVSGNYSNDRYPEKNKGVMHYLFNTRRKFLYKIIYKIKQSKYGNSKVNDILEVACGDGVLTRVLSKEFPKAKIVSNDISPGMVEAAKKTNLPNVNFFIRGQEPENKYDLIVYLGVFNSMDMDFELEYVSKHLKENGVFILGFTHKHSSIFFYRPNQNPDMHVHSLKKYNEKFSEKYDLQDTYAHTFFVPHLWKLPFADFLQNFIESIVLKFTYRPFHEQIYVLKLKK